MPPLVLTLFGLILLLAGAYSLVEGASKIAFAFGISELVVGLTIVAIGTSAPELAVSVAGALQGSAKSEIIIGNVVGSNIANIGLILGSSAFITVVNVPQQILRVDFLWLLGATALAGFFAWDSKYTAPEGAVLLLGVVAFSVFQYRIAARQSRQDAAERLANGIAAPDRRLMTLLPFAGMVVLGIGALALGSDWLVNGATEIATSMGINEYIIGLTLVAVGTSLPELATSLMGAWRGEGDIVVGNIVGSNIYNLLLILGAGMVITDLNIPDQVRTVQIPLMIGLTFVLYPILRSSKQVRKPEGLLLLLAYAAITAAAIVINPGE